MLGKYQLILASGSPRRKELLAYLNIPFKILVSNVDESFDPQTEPNKVAEELSNKKALAVAKELDFPAVVVAADTIVLLKNEIIGKPEDIGEAEVFLKKLSGQMHEVITGVSIFISTNNRDSWQKHTFSEISQVSFEKLETSILVDYLKTNESLDKAGAYGIQGASLPFVKEIRGSYSNIVGLPINRVHQELMKLMKTKDIKEFFK